jgi:beta-mannosidase
LGLTFESKINDCWPTTSWAIVDYFLRPKPAYFTIARELRPYTVGMTRKEKKTFNDNRSAAFFTVDTILEIWGTNNSLSEKNATLEVSSFDLESDWSDRWSKEIKLSANSSTELFEGHLPGQPTRTKDSEVRKVIVTSGRLLDETGAVLARYSNW